MQERTVNDYIELLKDSADKSKIRKKYIQLALKLHPDQSKKDGSEFIKLHEAYNLLKSGYFQKNSDYLDREPLRIIQKSSLNIEEDVQCSCGSIYNLKEYLLKNNAYCDIKMANMNNNKKKTFNTNKNSDKNTKDKFKNVNNEFLLIYCDFCSHYIKLI
ncbi:hypothetical protein EDEG_01339 [Edhazardia aedis USNM 41457]|uniref:J domain-containing protein n=1 Tax=Edhazardia aedis (strain USNM 41457) TaxID=1003232 RepID=J9DAD6_EDHAE|nr:hypothetical protein EDEG_01339 [Edhazardia aedis USNM 41457]|eukprot:EJW04469.1 hypothetical protein EDEG_01339 [Edhazardia aedis USNM 41457]